MANPPTARAFAEQLDPQNLQDFYVYLSQGAPDATPATFLLLGEAPASYQLALTPEAIAVGLTIETGDYADAMTDNELKLWLSVAPELRGLSAFNAPGVTVGIDLVVTTTASPPRVRAQTFLVGIVNQ